MAAAGISLKIIYIFLLAVPHSVISASQYDSPLDLSWEKDVKKPPLPTQVKQLPVTQEAPPKQALPPDKPAHQLDEKQSASKLDASAQLSNLPVEIVYEAQTDSSQHEVKPGRGEVATLTDIHSQDNVAEVDLISLVEEQIPKYVLRADTLTNFGGYDNQDFARNPALPPEADLDLTSELVEETLKYFILCSERLSQMTKTYHDIEAVTRLLEEKESDLELAARIGQGLLEKNKSLQTKNEHLEELLAESNEKISQLRHEVTMKDALLQMYREDVEHGTSPEEEFPATAVGLCDSDVLNKKVKQLEEENLKLKVQTEELAQATDSLEEQEMHLVNDCVQQLDTANKQVRQLQEELNTKGDVCHRQQEENTGLLSKLISLEGKHEKQIHENDELRQQVVDLQTTQMELTQELGELEERYEECVSLLYEKQNEIKTLRKKAAPSVIHQHYGTSPFFMPEGSLALELEKSQTEESCPEDYKAKNRRNHMSRVLETAKSVRRAIDRASSSASLASSVSMWSEDDSMRSSLCTTDIDSDTPSDIHSTSHLSGLGKPGVPGSNDLETALRRLTREEENNQLNDNVQSALDRREDDNTPTPCPTPDSYMSTGSANTQNMYRIPEKLQIVKPMEGSLTLHQWQKLATPRLDGVLESRPGVQIRGDRSLELEEEIYSITDIEEDDDLSFLLAKSPEDTAATFTYTTSKVMHPTENYSPNSRVTEVTQTATRPTSLPLQQNTPEAHGTSTFSMNRGLAEALQERDVKQEKADSEEHKGLMSLFTSWLRAPRRFSSLVTETPASSHQSHTSTVYTQASMYVPPLPGINSKPMKHQPEQAYLQLVSKMNEHGPHSILGIAEKTGISPVKRDPVDVGLNTMMLIRRNRITGATGQNKAQTLLSGSERGGRPDSGILGRVALAKSKSLKNQVLSRTGLGACTSPQQGVINRPDITRSKQTEHSSPEQTSRTGLMNAVLSGMSPLNSGQCCNTPDNTATTPRHPVSAPRHSTSTPRLSQGTAGGIPPLGLLSVSTQQTSLHTGPVYQTSVAGLGYAVSPPSIHSVTTARDNVYNTAPPHSGTNVGTGTVHSPHKTPRPQSSKTKSVYNSAEATIKILGQAVRARESCEMLGGLTSTPFSKS